jgi:aryl-alcohol dehydrogenase-like predicted oxidoreductase
MQTKKLGNSDMDITPIGFGAWALGGGGWAAAWGPQDDNDSVAAINEALDRGINWIDTAAIYGLGHSEDVVARALKGRADKPYIFTKCERVWDDKGQITGSLKADSVRHECEDSLRRLEVDVIDLYQIHWPEPQADIEEGWTTLAQLQQEGKVRWIGVSNFNVEQLRRAQKIAPITSLQPPYSLVNRSVEDEILPYCLEQNIGVINYSPMGAGLLTGTMTRERIANLPDEDWRKRGANFQEPRLTRHLKLVDILHEIATKHGRTPGEVSIAWTLYNPAVTAAIVGARNAGQIDGIIGALDFRLSEDEFEEIERFCRANP